MSALTNSFETSLLNLIFDNQAIANIGDAGGLQPSSADGNLYVALFTADPTDAGTTTSEANYTGYARVAVSRTDGWTISGDSATNAADITFGDCTAGSNVITHAAIMTASTGGTMLMHGVLDSPITVNTTNNRPKVTASNLTFTLD